MLRFRDLYVHDFLILVMLDTSMIIYYYFILFYVPIDSHAYVGDGHGRERDGQYFGCLHQSINVFMELTRMSLSFF
jgi:hypothetical protein